MRKRPRRGAPEAAPAKAQAQRHLSPADRLAVQAPLFSRDRARAPYLDWPPEHHLRFTVNARRREPHHWWLYTWEGRHQREFLERRAA